MALGGFTLKKGLVLLLILWSALSTLATVFLALHIVNTQQQQHEQQQQQQQQQQDSNLKPGDTNQQSASNNIRNPHGIKIEQQEQQSEAGNGGGGQRRKLIGSGGVFGFRAWKRIASRIGGKQQESILSSSTAGNGRHEEQGLGEEMDSLLAQIRKEMELHDEDALELKRMQEEADAKNRTEAGSSGETNLSGGDVLEKKGVDINESEKKELSIVKPSGSGGSSVPGEVKEEEEKAGDGQGVGEVKVLRRQGGTVADLLSSSLSLAGNAEGTASSSCRDFWPAERSSEDPWRSFKRVPAIAECTVQGMAIEELDYPTNFRRSYALSFSNSLGDKTHLLPYMRAAQDLKMAKRKRRVLIDIGPKMYKTFTHWFMTHYPLDFSEVHVFPGSSDYRLPPATSKKDEKIQSTALRNTCRMKSPAASQGKLPKWMVDRITVHKSLDMDTLTLKTLIEDTLGLTEEDAVVLKMDVQGDEWELLQDWRTDPRLPQIVDELFVKLYFDHPCLQESSRKQTGRSREQMSGLINEIRANGVYAHGWP